MTAYGYTRERARALHITASPLAHEAAVIARVQSMRTRGGRVPEPLSFAESQAYLRRVDRVRKRGVTVPQPINASLSRDSATTPPPEVAAGQAGANQEMTQ